MPYVLPSAELYSRVSCVILPPDSITPIWRSISYSSASRMKRNELTFFTSVLVPNFFSPRGNRNLTNFAIQGHRGQRCKLDGLPIQDRQGPGKSQANRAHVCIRWITETGRAGAKNLGRGQQLDVHLKPDHRLVFGTRWRR